MMSIFLVQFFKCWKYSLAGPVQDSTSSRVDYELETPDFPLSTENTGLVESLEPDTKSEKSTISQVTSILKSSKVASNDMDLEEEDEDMNTMSIFAAARDFKLKQIENQARKKSVRFLNATPKSKTDSDGKFLFDWDKVRTIWEFAIVPRTSAFFPSPRCAIMRRKFQPILILKPIAVLTLQHMQSILQCSD